MNRRSIKNFLQILMLATVLPACFQARAAKVGDTTTSQGGTDEGCLLSLAVNNVAGLCGSMVLTNTGTIAMTGWAIEFDLTQNGHLSSTWGGIFAVEDNVIRVTPASDEDATLEPGQTVTLGYCADTVPQDVVLTAGACSELKDAEAR